MAIQPLLIIYSERANALFNILDYYIQNLIIAHCPFSYY